MIKVIVIDDHPVVREILKQITGEALGVTVVAETGDDLTSVGVPD